jgi:hypothetical protein
MDSYLHQNIVGITNRSGKISNYEMGKLLGLPKKQLDLIQGTANMMNAFDFKVAGDHTDIKALMKRNNFRNYKKNFTRIEYIKDNLNEYKRNYDRKILSLSKQAEVATPTIQQELLKQQKALQDDFANKTGYRIGGFGIEKGRVTINPQTLRLPDLKNPYNDTLQQAMRNFNTTGLPGKKGTTFNQIDQRLINATPQERIEIFEEISGTDKAKKSKYLKALQKVPKIGKLATAVIGGTAGAVGISSLATAEEPDQKYAPPEDIEFGDPETWDKKVLDFVATPAGMVGLNLAVGVDPKETFDRTLLEAELAATPGLVKGAEAMTKNPLLRKALTLGIGPRLAAGLSGVGIAALAGEGLYELGKRGVAEYEKLQAMTPEEKQAYLAEQVDPLMDEGGMVDISREGFKDGSKPPKMDRRKFMKIMGGIASLPVLGKFVKIAKPLTPAVSKAVDGMPTFIFDLIAKVKSKAEATGMKYFTGNRADEFADVYQADNFVVTEKGNKITLREIDDPDRPGYRENEIEIEVDPETGGVTYNEASARPDMEGKLKDVEEYIDEDDLENMRKYTYDE